MNKQRVLFLCAHNVARSQMAESLLRKHAGDQFDVVILDWLRAQK